MHAIAAPADFFSPSAERAALIDQAVRASLADSLGWCFGQVLEPGWLAWPPAWRARALDFGAYYDLLLKLTADDGDASAAARAFAQPLLDSIHRADRAAPASTSTLRISTLRAPWYDAADIACLVRWFDIEPDNSMALSAVDDVALADASSRLHTALQVMQRWLPEFHDEMLALTDEIIFARPSGAQTLSFGGASSFSLWGAMALNADAHPDWWRYLPRLVHEYSHNLLFGIAREEPLLLNDPGERYLSPLRQTWRPLDGIYYAAFVSAREALAMRMLLSRMNTDSAQEAGIDDVQIPALRIYCERTLAEANASFADCCTVVRQHGRLTALGDAVLCDTERAMG